MICTNLCGFYQTSLATQGFLTSVTFCGFMVICDLRRLHKGEHLADFQSVDALRRRRWSFKRVGYLSGLGQNHELLFFS